MNIKLIKINKLRKFCKNVFIKSGLSDKDAIIATDVILFANIRGIDSHGIVRLPTYINRLKAGGINSKPNIKSVKARGSIVIVDGDNGMGQVIGNYGVSVAIKKAKKYGISFVGVYNSDHFGVASYYSINMAKANMIGIAMSNTPPNSVAWGGSNKVIGNNPLSIAIPYDLKKQIVLDISMSKVSGGKILMAAIEKKKIPKDWIIDGNGKQTDDPNEFFRGGALLPFGEHKGYGLAFMIEVLTGVLTGAGMLSQVPPWSADANIVKNCGHCFICINIEKIMNLKDFKARLDWVIKQIKSSKLAEGSDGIFIPGEKEWEIEEKRKKDGIAISEEIWQELEKIARNYNEPL